MSAADWPQCDDERAPGRQAPTNPRSGEMDNPFRGEGRAPTPGRKEEPPPVGGGLHAEPDDHIGVAHEEVGRHRREDNKTTPTKTSAKEKAGNSPSNGKECRNLSPEGISAPYFAGYDGTIGGLHAGRRDGAQEDGRQREGGGPRPQQREKSQAAMPALTHNGGDSKLGRLHARRRGDDTLEDGRGREEGERRRHGTSDEGR